MLSKLIDSYLEYLISHPEIFLEIQVYTMIMVPFNIIMFMNRKEMIKGVTGGNTFWEAPEQYAYIAIWVSFPVFTYNGIFEKEMPSLVAYFFFGVVGYTLGGRWIFEWLLAFRAGKSEVTETTTNTKRAIVIDEKEVKQETK